MPLNELDARQQADDARTAAAADAKRLATHRMMVRAGFTEDAERFAKGDQDALVRAEAAERISEAGPQLDELDRQKLTRRDEIKAAADRVGKVDPILGALMRSHPAARHTLADASALDAKLAGQVAFQREAAVLAQLPEKDVELFRKYRSLGDRMLAAQFYQLHAMAIDRVIGHLTKGGTP